jgi:hypothetical protein
VVWKAGGTEKTGPFEPLTAYAAAVTLYAGAGYIFSGGGAQATHGGGTLNDPAEWTAAGPSLTGIIITFPAAGKGKPIPAPLILTNLIPAPVTNGSPVTSFFAGAFCGTVVWTATLGGGAHSGLFGTGAAYTAAVSLYPASGYVFPESVPVTHGDLGIADFTGEPRQGTISFPATHIHSSFSGPFSGSSDEEEDSVIDLIRAAKDAGLGSLYLHLPTWKLTEEVSLGAEGQDIPGEGLVLNTTNSPAEVIIDGGGRTIQLTGGGTGSLITLEAGVTLTIRNITFMANPFFNGAPLVHEIGEMLILETGAVIYEDVAAGGTVNYAPVDNDAPNIWEIHTFTETGLLEFIIGVPETAEVLVVGGAAAAAAHRALPAAAAAREGLSITQSLL